MKEKVFDIKDVVKDIFGFVKSKIGIVIELEFDIMKKIDIDVFGIDEFFVIGEVEFYKDVLYM